MPFFKSVIFIYSLLLLAGAYFGFKAGSQISLVAGLVSGTLVLLGIFLLGSHPSLGHSLILLTSGILSVTFFLRFLKSFKFMPSGMLLIASLIVLILTIRHFLSK